MFEDVVQSEEELRTVYRPPSEGARRKQIDRLDDNCRAFIAHSPFVLVGTADAEGNCDVSPKGGPPGFVLVLDEHHLAIPDLVGNNRMDSMRNLISSASPSPSSLASPSPSAPAGRGSGIALLFLIPGLDETLRVNGRAWVVRDADVLDRGAIHDRRPKTAFGVEVDEAFIHCAKAFRRSALWQPDLWPDRGDMPTVACMLRDHVDQPGVTPEAIQAGLDHNYATKLW